MYDAKGHIQGDTNGNIRSGVCGMSNMQSGVQAGRSVEAHFLYGEKGRLICESIQGITRFQPGYPKRVEVGVGCKNMEAWQRFFDWEYEMTCKIHNITPEPKRAEQTALL